MGWELVKRSGQMARAHCGRCGFRGNVYPAARMRERAFGYCPYCVSALAWRAWPATLVHSPLELALAALLTDDALDDATLADFRGVVEAVAARFSGRVLPARTPPRRLGR